MEDAIVQDDEQIQIEVVTILLTIFRALEDSRPS